MKRKNVLILIGATIFLLNLTFLFGIDSPWGNLWNIKNSLFWYSFSIFFFIIPAVILINTEKKYEKQEKLK